MRPSRLHSALNPLVLQVASTALAGVLVIGTVFVASRAVAHRSTSASDNSNAALIATHIHALVEDVYHLRLDAAAGQSADDQTRIPLATAIEAHDNLQMAAEAAEDLHLLVGSDITLQIWGATGEAVTELAAYLESETTADFESLLLRLSALRALTEEHGPQFEAAAQRDQDALRFALDIAWLVIVLISAVTVVGVSALTMVIGRRLGRVLRQAQAEQIRLMEAGKAMARRNEQFAAFYQIVSEVTETLSLKYVIGTTIREVRKLVGADVAVLRLLRDDQLVLAGTEQEQDSDIQGLAALPLGVGLVGRVAKRGKTVRISEGAEASMEDGERIPGVQSGIIVPLIVGARVVGTLGCWSRVPGLFSDDDERVLEMMASQVATAIAAANVHEATARDAHHDALTLLPNRRQLAEDLRGVLAEALAASRPMAIAMIDIDHFKRLNDEHGHKIGDVTLQRVAKTLRAALRAEDRLYRYGGEEFLVVFANVDAEAGGALAERLRAEVEHMPLLVDQGDAASPVTISIGVAAFPGDGEHLEELIDTADRAMYASKEAGRNRVMLAGDVADHWTRDRKAA